MKVIGDIPNFVEETIEVDADLYYASSIILHHINTSKFLGYINANPRLVRLDCRDGKSAWDKLNMKKLTLMGEKMKLVSFEGNNGRSQHRLVLTDTNNKDITIGFLGNCQGTPERLSELLKNNKVLFSKQLCETDLQDLF